MILTLNFLGADLQQLTREVFMQAFKRHVPNVDDPEASIDTMKVIHEDWMGGLGKVRATNNAVYGSSLYIPIIPNASLNP